MAKEPRSPRTRLFVKATLHVGSRRTSVTIRNLSPTGARVELPFPPPVGTAVELRRGSLIGSGKIVWVVEGACGLHFETPIFLGDWVPNAGQQKVDEVVALAKAGFSADDVDGAPNEFVPDEILNRIAQEIDYVARMLGGLGDSLTDDPYVTARHGVELQDLDVAMQILGHLSRLIVAPDRQASIAAIGMAELRRRLTRKTL